jgi:Acyclic terpene utilisation family protein AtuA
MVRITGDRGFESVSLQRRVRRELGNRLKATHIVGMMGVEPIQQALRSGAQIVVAGRSSDTSIFAALPLLEGYAPAVVWHMAKILECGAAAVAVRTAPDCMMAVLHEDSFDVFPLREDYHCTPRAGIVPRARGRGGSAWTGVSGICSVHEIIPWAGQANYAASKGGVSMRQVPSVRRRSLCISLFAVGRGIEAVREALPTVLASVPPPAVLTRDFPVETERRPGVQMGSVQT